ncbi:MAG: hypothetical protein FOGNACKC_05311 [Anaerolineae bacterium]|nr:hypothetical protein [Anaerolineae bacterium]
MGSVLQPIPLIKVQSVQFTVVKWVKKLRQKYLKINSIISAAVWTFAAVWLAGVTHGADIQSAGFTLKQNRLDVVVGLVGGVDGVPAAMAGRPALLIFDARPILYPTY